MTWRQSVAAWIAASVFLTYLAFLPPLVIAPDERSMLAVSLAMLDGGLSVPQAMGSPGVDGRYYSNWYPLNSVLALPASAVARAAGARLGLDPMYVAAPLAIVLTAAATALTAATVFTLARALGAQGTVAFIAAIGYAFGTIVLAYGRTFFADPLLAFLAALGTLDAITRRGGWRPAAVAALAVLAKPTGIVVGPTVAAYHLWRREVRPAVASLAGSVVGFGVYAAYNAMRFGNPLTFGQRWDGFTLCCIPQALAGLAISPGRGLLWYAPIAALGLVVTLARLRRAPHLALVAGVFFGFLGLHAVWGQWQGGWSWGPRLLLPAVPGLVAAAALAPRRVLTAAAVVGFVVNAPLLVSSYQRYTAFAADRGVSAHAQVWSFADAPLLNAWGSAAAQIDTATRSDVRALVREAGVDERRAADAEVYRVVPVWWWMLPVAGIPRAAGLVVALGLMASGLWAFRRAWQTARVGAAA
jgi:hypothetical protein